MEAYGELRKSNLINPLNADLNPIRHMLALVGAHHIVHVSRRRVKIRLSFVMARTLDGRRGVNRRSAETRKCLPCSYGQLTRGRLFSVRVVSDEKCSSAVKIEAAGSSETSASR